MDAMNLGGNIYLDKDGKLSDRVKALRERVIERGPEHYRAKGEFVTARSIEIAKLIREDIANAETIWREFIVIALRGVSALTCDINAITDNQNPDVSNVVKVLTKLDAIEVANRNLAMFCATVVGNGWATREEVVGAIKESIYTIDDEVALFGYPLGICKNQEEEE